MPPVSGTGRPAAAIRRGDPARRNPSRGLRVGQDDAMGKGDKSGRKHARKLAEEQAAEDEATAPLEAEAVDEIGNIPGKLRVGTGFVLADLDPSSTPGFSGDKAEGKAALAASEA